MNMMELRLVDSSRVLEQLSHNTSDETNQLLFNLRHLHILESDNSLIGVDILS